MYAKYIKTLVQESATVPPAKATAAPAPAKTEKPNDTGYQFVSAYTYGENTYYGILNNGKPDVYGALLGGRPGYVGMV